MSISRIRHYMDKGCGVVLGVVMLVVVALGFLVNGAGKSVGIDPSAKPKPPLVTMATVGQTVISPRLVETLAREKTSQATKQFGMMADQFMSVLQLRSYIQSVQDTITFARAIEYGKANGVSLSDSDIEKVTVGTVDASVKQIRSQMEQQGLIKAGASDEEFEKAFSGAIGMTSDDYRKKSLAKVKAEMDDPNLALAVKASATLQALQSKIASTILVNEDTLKTYYSTFQVKRVLFGKGETARVDADNVLAKIQSGSLKLDDAINQYSKDPIKDKKLSESIVPMPASAAFSDSKMSALLNLKQGEMSPVISNDRDGYMIVSVDSITTNLPADYEKNKERTRKSVQETLVKTKLDAEISKESYSDVKWEMPIFKAAMDYAKLTSTSPKGEVSKEQLKGILAQLKEPGVDPTSQELATLVRLQVTESLYKLDKTNADSYVEAIQGYLRANESGGLRLTLAQLLYDKKAYPEAGLELQQSASSNFGTDDAAKTHTDQIRLLYTQLKSTGKLPPETDKAITRELDRWQADKQAAEKATIEQQRLIEEDKKRSEEAAKKLKEDAAKAPAAKGK